MAVVGLEHVAMPRVLGHLEQPLHGDVGLYDVELGHNSPLCRVANHQPPRKPRESTSRGTRGRSASLRLAAPLVQRGASAMGGHARGIRSSGQLTKTNRFAQAWQGL